MALKPTGSWFYWQDSSLFVHIYLQPRASQNQAVGIHLNSLKVRITDPPINNRANLGLINFLAKLFDVPKQRIQLVSGEHNRNKWVRIDSPVDLSILSI